MIGEIIISIPIYRCSPEKFYKELKIEKERLKVDFKNRLFEYIKNFIFTSPLLSITIQS